MRLLVLLLCCFAAPAMAWEFEPLPVCTLRNDGPPRVEVTYDPRAAEPYAITVTADTPWPDAAVFALAFEGGRSLTITTTRHRLSDDGLSLTVSDRGFGNVLAGLEFNTVATAVLAGSAQRFSLEGAAPEVQRFRDCLVAPVA